ncbi:MAG TPA: hypothetical protein VD767_09250, partial [Thermomicrobiales bacterium]|nr:hypothetical protein [Thermomicrobiales bacterium]
MIRFARSILPLSLVLTIVMSVVYPAVAAPTMPGAGQDAAGIAPPGVTATAVYSYDLATGIVLYEKNADERMQIGSTVKVATALVAVAHAETSE